MGSRLKVERTEAGRAGRRLAHLGGGLSRENGHFRPIRKMMMARNPGVWAGEVISR